VVAVCVLVSGGGTNLQALIDAEREGRLRNGRIARVVSSDPGAFALERAKRAGIGCAVVCPRDYGSPGQYDGALVKAVEESGASLVVLAGFLHILGPDFCRAFSNRIINIHPSLVPSFCGRGFYGLRVHEAALRYGVKITGATAHFVNDIPDGGAVILQRAVCVREDDTAESLQKRVMEEAEWRILPEAVSLFCEGRLQIEGNRVRIRP